MVSKVVSVILALATLFLISSAAVADSSRDLAETTTSVEERAAFEGIGKIIGKIFGKFKGKIRLPKAPKGEFCRNGKILGHSVRCCPSYRRLVNTRSCAYIKFGSNPTPRPCCLVK